MEMPSGIHDQSTSKKKQYSEVLFRYTPQSVVALIKLSPAPARSGQANSDALSGRMIAWGHTSLSEACVRRAVPSMVRGP